MSWTEDDGEEVSFHEDGADLPTWFLASVLLLLTVVLGLVSICIMGLT